MLKNTQWISPNSSFHNKNDGFYLKEDIEDQLNSKKTELNQFVDENTKLRTKNAVLKEQLKEKDRLIDELLQGTYSLGAKVEKLAAGSPLPANGAAYASAPSAQDGLVSDNSGGQSALSNNICKALS